MLNCRKLVLGREDLIEQFSLKLPLTPTSVDFVVVFLSTCPLQGSSSFVLQSSYSPIAQVLQELWIALPLQVRVDCFELRSPALRYHDPD
jgi:hypothetical protein